MKYRQLLDNTAILRHRNIDIYWYKQEKERRGGSLPNDNANSSGENVNRRWITHIRWSREYKFIKLIISIIDLPPHLDRIQVKYKPLFLRWNDIFTRGLVFFSLSRSETKRRKIVEERFSKNGRDIRKNCKCDRSSPKVEMRMLSIIDPLSTFVSNETPCT